MLVGWSGRPRIDSPSSPLPPSNPLPTPSPPTVAGISAQPYEDNVRYFNVVIAGPESSPYEGGTFKLELFLPAEYPMAPPKVRTGTHARTHAVHPTALALVSVDD